MKTSKKTYAEKWGNKPFDWNKFLKKAIAGKITLKEAEHAEMLARQWPTCACGNQCAVIKRGYDGCPEDSSLEELGIDFSSHIDDQDYNAAKKTLEEIEERAAALISVSAEVAALEVACKKAGLDVDIEMY